MTKRARICPWKTVPCCLPSHSVTRVLNRDQLDSLCREGLGTLWFTREVDPLVLELLNARELHFLLTTLYPSLKNIPYQFCRAGGPGHQVIVPLSINESDMEPSLDYPFTPYFTVEQLKGLVGRKGCLYLRPLQELPKCTRVSQVEVYVFVCCCLFCYINHMYVCSGEPNEMQNLGK